MRYLGLLLIAALGCYVSAASPDSAHDKDDKAETKQTDGPTILEDPLLHLGFAWKDVSAWTKQAAKNVKAELDKVDLGETGKQVSHAGTSISSWVNEAAKDVKAETDKIDLTGANEWIRDSASAIQDALNKENATGFEKWVSQVSTGIGLEAALEDLKYITLEDVPAETWQYIQDNPGQTAFYVVEGVALIAPGALFGPLLKVAGFGGVGHRARTVATTLQRMYGPAVPAGGWLATLTSAGGGRYGRAALARMTRGAATLAGAVKVAANRASNTTTAREEL